MRVRLRDGSWGRFEKGLESGVGLGWMRASLRLQKLWRGSCGWKGQPSNRRPRQQGMGIPGGDAPGVNAGREAVITALTGMAPHSDSDHGSGATWSRELPGRRNGLDQTIVLAVRSNSLRPSW